MTKEREAEIRATAMIYFAERAISYDETLRMSVEEIIAMYEYVSGKIITKARR
jgi:hypothetical protein